MAAALGSHSFLHYFLISDSLGHSGLPITNFELYKSKQNFLLNVWAPYAKVTALNRKPSAKLAIFWMKLNFSIVSPLLKRATVMSPDVPISISVPISNVFLVCSCFSSKKKVFPFSYKQIYHSYFNHFVCHDQWIHSLLLSDFSKNFITAFRPKSVPQFKVKFLLPHNFWHFPPFISWLLLMWPKVIIFLSSCPTIHFDL